MNQIVKRADLKEGMIVFKDVITSYGTILVNRGTVVDSRVLELLQYNGIPSVSILIEDSVGDGHITTYLDKLRESDRFKELSKNYEIAYESVSGHFNDVLNREKQVDKEKIVDEINKIIANTDSSKDLFDALNGLRYEKSTMYQHSLNTALISNMLARWLKMSEEEVNDITMAGLFHDIGLMMVPQEVLEKAPDARSDAEKELFQKHTIQGYRYLMKRELNRQIGLTALTHHERMDGKGYPLQCIGSSLCTYSKIVAIADAYDEQSLNSDGSRNPFDLILQFEKEGLIKFDPQFIMVFLAGIMDTYIGCDILLSNGLIGTIIFINRDNMSRPMVKIDDQYINLAAEPTLQIVKFV